MPRINDKSPDFSEAIIAVYQSIKGYYAISNHSEIHHFTMKTNVYEWRALCISQAPQEWESQQI